MSGHAEPLHSHPIEPHHLFANISSLAPNDNSTNEGNSKQTDNDISLILDNEQQQLKANNYSASNTRTQSQTLQQQISSDNYQVDSSLHVNISSSSSNRIDETDRNQPNLINTTIGSGLEGGVSTGCADSISSQVINGHSIVDKDWNQRSKEKTPMPTGKTNDTILRDCSVVNSSSTSNDHLYQIHNEQPLVINNPSDIPKASDSDLNITVTTSVGVGSNNNKSDNLINISDHKRPAVKSHSSFQQQSIQDRSVGGNLKAAGGYNQNRTANTKSVPGFKSLLSSSSSINSSPPENRKVEGDEIVDIIDTRDKINKTTTFNSVVRSNEYCDKTRSINDNNFRRPKDGDRSVRFRAAEGENIYYEVIDEEENEEEEDLFNVSYSDNNAFNKDNISSNRKFLRHNNDTDEDDELSQIDRRSKSPSYLKGRLSLGRRVLNTVKSTFNFVSTTTSDKATELPYSRYEDKDLLTGSPKYNSSSKPGGRTFRGSYKYSRAKISMAILQRLFSTLIQRSTLALLGAFLIHITLGTVYTLSNINSYLTSYMRLHGSPNATYGGSMWISSSYAVGQGISMVLGGYVEKRFSARVACIIGCILHSGAIVSTRWSVNHGPLAVLFTYGFLPGFGCGMAYMTPMSNGFSWFPNRKGLVAGVILAGFGIGTFIFNMAQTAYVNPDNLSPPENANGYFTQESILDKVPHLFVFIGSIYAAMQFVGCCLLFKPPSSYSSASGGGKSLDERPILVETEMPLKRAIRRREFIVLFVVYGVTTQGVLFVNSMIKEYGQIFIGNDMYLAWTGSMASIANSAGRLAWGLAIDRFSFTQCFTSITIIFGSLMFIMPFEFVLSSKLLYLLCTLGLFGSFSGWMSTYPVHLSRVFGRTNSGMIYGLIFVSQSLGCILTALGAHYLIDHYSRFVPFFCVVLLEIVGLAIYHMFYPK